ncbi:MAG: phosphonate C-P lyase system protein PhnH [Ruminococcus sp.]|nr:phosphonate C-P lyase system protein PhnH [Ruminococcus sp.]
MKQLHSFDEVFDSQAVYRRLLEAMSNPCRVLSIREQADKMYGDKAAFLAIAMTLLDNEMSFYTGSDSKLAADISLLTLAQNVSVNAADFIFISDSSELEEAFAQAKCGTLADPQLSATLIIKDNGQADRSFRLYGAGIDGTAEVSLSETAAKAIALRDAQNYEYPQGVDMIFVSDEGTIFCIPRLVLKEGA